MPILVTYNFTVLPEMATRSRWSDECVPGCVVKYGAFSMGDWGPRLSASFRKVPRLAASLLRGRARLDASELGRRCFVDFLIGPVVSVA